MPPMRSRVTRVVEAPSSAARRAASTPAGPAPTTTPRTTPHRSSSPLARAAGHVYESRPTSDEEDGMAKGDWSKPAAMAIPKEGYHTLEKGRYGPIYPRTPACHGFTIIAKV